MSLIVFDQDFKRFGLRRVFGALPDANQTHLNRTRTRAQSFKIKRVLSAYAGLSFRIRVGLVFFLQKGIRCINEIYSFIIDRNNLID